MIYSVFIIQLDHHLSSKVFPLYFLHCFIQQFLQSLSVIQRPLQACPVFGGKTIWLVITQPWLLTTSQPCVCVFLTKCLDKAWGTLDCTVVGQNLNVNFPTADVTIVILGNGSHELF